MKASLAVLVVLVLTGGAAGAYYVEQVRGELREVRADSELEISSLRSMVSDLQSQLEGDFGESDLASRVDDLESGLDDVAFDVRRVNSRLSSCLLSISSALRSTYSRSIFC